MIPYCQRTGVGLIPWSPNARGVLTRPYDSRDSLREQTDKNVANYVRKNESETDRQIIGKVEEIARRKGVKMAQVATAWCLSKGVMPIVGLGSKERIDQAVESLKVKLSVEELEELEGPYAPKKVSGY